MDIVWKGSPNFDSNRKPIDRIVIHWFGVGFQTAADAMFQKPNGTSAHYSIENTSVHQYVQEDKVAYHAGVYAMNQRSIGIEHSAEPNRPATDETYQMSGQLVREICQRYNIPLDRTHIIKHSEVPRATACPGTMDIERIISIAKGVSMPETLVVNKADWEKVLANSNTLDSVTDKLGVPRNSNASVVNAKIDQVAQNKYNEGYAKGKAEVPAGTPTSKPPKVLKLADGDEVTRNGVKWLSGGQLEATYQEK